MRKINFLFIVIIALITLSSCTKNQRVKRFGGEAELKIEKGQKLVDATWKGDELWLLTTKREATETPKTYYFKEKSSYGVMEGTYVIKEQ